MSKKSIPGWTTNTDEISNVIFKVTLTDAYGRKAEIVGDATDETIEKAMNGAFDIEKQISKNWNLFLYDLSIQKLADTETTIKEYHDKSFHSWCIEREDKRVVYDGKEALLIFQTKSKNDWTDNETIKSYELKYSNFVRLINRLTETTVPNSTLPKVGRTWWQKLFGSE